MNLSTSGPKSTLITFAQAQPTRHAPMSDLVMSFGDSISEPKIATPLRRLGKGMERPMSL